MQLRHKTFLITGASSGIGRACAEALANEGARLILTARRRDALEAVAANIGGADVVPGDLMIPASVSALCDQISANYDRIDGIIHSAGVGMYVPSYESDPQNVRRLMELNFLAPVEITRRPLAEATREWRNHNDQLRRRQNFAALA